MAIEGSTTKEKSSHSIQNFVVDVFKKKLKNDPKNTQGAFDLIEGIFSRKNPEIAIQNIKHLIRDILNCQLNWESLLKELTPTEIKTIIAQIKQEIERVSQQENLEKYFIDLNKTEALTIKVLDQDILKEKGNTIYLPLELRLSRNLCYVRTGSEFSFDLERKSGLEEILFEKLSDDKRILAKGHAQNKFFIKGVVGAGKTTLVKAFLSDPDVQKQYIQEHKIPLFLTAKKFAKLITTNKPFSNLTLLLDEYKKNSVLASNLDFSQLEVDFFIDGLDEVGTTEQQKMILDYIQEEGQDNRYRFIVQTRIIDEVETIERNNYFQTIQIKQLETSEEQNLFINQYLKNLKEVNFKKVEEFKKFLLDSPLLSNLSKTPVMLSHLCIAFKNRIKQHPESDVQTIFQNWTLADILKGSFAHILEERETAYENYHRFDLIRNNKNIFNLLAYETFRNNGVHGLKVVPNNVFEKVLTNFSEGEETKRQLKSQILESNILYKNSNGDYEFGHLSYKEFFLAEYFISLNQNKTVQHGEEYLQGEFEIFKTREENPNLFYDNFFREMLKFYVSMLPDETRATSFLERIAFKRDVNLEFDSVAQMTGGNFVETTNQHGLLNALNLEKYSPYVSGKLLFFDEIKKTLQFVQKNPEKCFQLGQRILNSISPNSREYLKSIVIFFLNEFDDTFLEEKIDLMKTLLVKLGKDSFEVVNAYLNKTEKNNSKNLQESKVKLLKFVLHNLPEEGVELIEGVLGEDENENNRHLKLSVLKIALRYLNPSISQYLLQLFLKTSSSKEQIRAIQYALKTHKQEAFYLLRDCELDFHNLTHLVQYALDYLQCQARPLVKMFLEDSQYTPENKIQIIDYALPYLRQEVFPLVEMFLENVKNESMQIQVLKKVFLTLRTEALSFLSQIVENQNYQDDVKIGFIKTVIYEMGAEGKDLAEKCFFMMQGSKNKLKLFGYIQKYCLNLKPSLEQSKREKTENDQFEAQILGKHLVNEISIELTLMNIPNKLSKINDSLRLFGQEAFSLIDLNDFSNPEDKIILLKNALKHTRSDAIDLVRLGLGSFNGDHYNRCRILEYTLKYAGEAGLEFVKSILIELQSDEIIQLNGFALRVLERASFDLLEFFLAEKNFKDEDKIAFLKKAAFYYQHKSKEEFQFFFKNMLRTFFAYTEEKASKVRILKFLIYVFKEASFDLIREFIFDDNLDQKIKVNVLQAAIYYLKKESISLIEPFLQCKQTIISLENKNELLKSALKHLQEEAFSLFKCFFENFSEEDFDAKAKAVRHARLYVKNSHDFMSYAISQHKQEELKEDETKNYQETNLLDILIQKNLIFKKLQTCLENYNFNFSSENFCAIWKQQPNDSLKYVFYQSVKQNLTNEILSNLKEVEIDTHSLEIKLIVLKEFLENTFEHTVEFWLVKTILENNLKTTSEIKKFFFEKQTELFEISLDLNHLCIKKCQQIFKEAFNKQDIEIMGSYDMTQIIAKQLIGNLVGDEENGEIGNFITFTPRENSKIILSPACFFNKRDPSAKFGFLIAFPKIIQNYGLAPVFLRKIALYFQKQGIDKIYANTAIYQKNTYVYIDKMGGKIVGLTSRPADLFGEELKERVDRFDVCWQVEDLIKGQNGVVFCSEDVPAFSVQNDLKNLLLNCPLSKQEMLNYPQKESEGIKALKQNVSQIFREKMQSVPFVFCVPYYGEIDLNCSEEKSLEIIKNQLISYFIFEEIFHQKLLITGDKIQNNEHSYYVEKK